MTEKIRGFLEFVQKWVKGLEEPEAPEFGGYESIWTRIESVLSPIAVFFLFFLILLPFGVQNEVGYNRGPEWPIIFAVLIEFLILCGVYFIHFLIPLPFMLMDYVIRGEDSDGYSNWYGVAIGSAVFFLLHPITILTAIPAHLITLRRFRREMQSYLAKRIKAESIIADLNRPDAEDIFSDVKDTDMLRGMLER